MERDEKGRFKSSVVIKGYKGFEQDFTCRNKKYSIGKIFRSAAAILCHKGLHFCTNALNVLDYYGPADSVYASVEASGKIASSSGDYKAASTRLKIIKELSLTDLLRSFLEDLRAKEGNIDSLFGSVTATESGTCASCRKGTAVAAAPYGGAIVRADYSVAVGSSDHTGAYAEEDNSAAIVSQTFSIARVNGYDSVAVALNSFSAAIASGMDSVAISANYDSIAEAEGPRSLALAVAGYAHAKVPGSTAMALGPGDLVKGVLGALLIAPDSVYIETPQSSLDCRIKSYKCVLVDGKRIKVDTWYSFRHGEWVPKY